MGDKVPAADKTKVEGLVKDLREAISKDDDERIKQLTPELQQALFSVGSNLYQQSGGGPTAGGPSPDDSGSTPSGGGDDVIDADFTESK